jgi:hypothetical protein
MIEGYVILAPYRCMDEPWRLRCLAEVPEEWFGELRGLIDEVAAFYRDAYGQGQLTCYEQGRGGGTSSWDTEGRFPHHPHLCCLPGSVDLDPLLAREFQCVPVHDIAGIREVIGIQPYVYVDSGHASMRLRHAYVAANKEEQHKIERLRLKQILGEALGCAERSDWRVYPGNEELARLTKSFRTWQASAT